MANILRSSLISIAATMASLVAGFASNIVVGRMLGPSGTGTVAFALWAATSASAVADIGMPQTLLRNIGAATGRGEDWKGLVHSGLRAFLISVPLVGVAILAWAAWRARSDVSAGCVWALTAALFASYALAAFSTAVARGRDRFGETAISTVIGGLVQVPLVLIGAWFWGAAGALIGHVARYLPQALRLKGYLRHPRRPLTAPMRRYGRNMWLSDLIEIMILSRVEFLFLGLFFAATQIGYFAAGLALAGLIEQLALQIAPALIVGFADAHARGDMVEVERAYQRVIRVVALIILPVCLGGAAIMPALLPLVFGPLFVPAVPAAVILMAFAWPAALCVIPWGLISAAGHSNQILRIQIGSGLVTMLLLLAIVPWGGLEGAAWSRAAIGTLTFASLAAIARAHGGASVPWIALGRTIAAAGLCALAALVPVLLLSGIAAVLLGIAAGALVYALAVRLLGLIGPDEAASLLGGIADRLPAGAKPFVSGLCGLVAPR
jgi:O-antigen/teichoic acid export membrane protein